MCFQAGTYGITEDGLWVCHFVSREGKTIKYYQVYLGTLHSGEDLVLTTEPFSIDDSSHWGPLTLIPKEKALMLVATVGAVLP